MEAAPPPRVANLHAFARLYGVVRWFHPSDGAAAVDWNRFAIDGARRVVDAPDARALRDTLTALFAPIAPTVRIAGAGEPLVDDPALHPADPAGLDVIAWEHRGFGDSVLVSVYQSKRRHRTRMIEAPATFASLAQKIDATPYRGGRMRLRGKVRAPDGGRGQLWMRVDRPNGGMGFFDNMNDRPISAATWTDGEIIGTVSPDATAIMVGVLIIDGAGASFDDIAVAFQAHDGDAWRPIAIADPGFEDPDAQASWHAGTGKGTRPLDGWAVTVDPDHPAGGKTSLRLAHQTTELSDEIFDDAPAPGETVDVDLGAGLRARVPIALYSKAGHTLGDDPASAAKMAPPIAAPAGYDPIAGAADVIVVWNVLEHFWPYWNIVKVDWNGELDTALADALDDRSADDHLATLQRISAAAPDGHASVRCPGTSPIARPPFTLDWIEDRVVVTASADPQLQRGDVIVSIDGRDAREALDAATALTSGSPQWRREIALLHLGRGAPGSTAHVRVHRDAGDVDLEVKRVEELTAEPAARKAIEQLAGGIWYVDLSRAEVKDLDAVMTKLAAAPGVVFDLRGYPNGNHFVLSHLFTRDDDSRGWMAVTRVIRPDHPAGATWDTFQWLMPKLEPHIGGKVAFLTGPGAISYAESVMGLVEHYKLGAIVGAATAGTNGNIAQIAEPTGCKTIFTGMRVTKHDGSQHHLIGVQPTVPAARTIAGVRAGRDEVLERALEVVGATH